MPISEKMASDESPAQGETPLQRRVRVLLLRRLVQEGAYLVPAEDIAQSLLRHLGLIARAPLPQQR